MTENSTVCEIDKLIATDVLLIGAGPIGLEVASALKALKIDYFHIEAGSIGATIGWYAPGTSIFSSPDRLSLAGIPFLVSPHLKATREDYLQYLRLVVLQNKLQVSTFSRATSIKMLDDGRFECIVHRVSHGVGGEVEYLRAVKNKGWIERPDFKIIARRVICAIGDMHLPHKIDVVGEDLRGVSHYLSDPHDYTGLRVVIVGSGNSAIEAAIRLTRVNAKVTLCMRREQIDVARIKPWLTAEYDLLIKSGHLKAYMSVEIDRINLSHVVAKHRTLDQHELKLPYDKVLLLTGYRQDPSLLKMLGISLSGASQAPSYDSLTMETSVPNVFVAGTCVAGTQLGGVKEFVETSHVHVDRIISKITGQAPPFDCVTFQRPLQDREM